MSGKNKNSEKITPGEFERRMKEYKKRLGPEIGHVKADNLMEQVLRQHGYEEGVDIFHEMGKWYA